LILSLSVVLGGCGGPKLINGYRPDETAQLSLLLRQVLEKLKTEDFIVLYRTYAGSRLQQHLPERAFLRRAQCVNKTFGKLTTVPSSLPEFERSEHPTFGVTDHVSAGLNYSHGPVKLDLIVIPFGDTFKLWDVTWQAKYPETPQGKALTSCLAKLG
jgi:hypothetical protein